MRRIVVQILSLLFVTDVSAQVFGGHPPSQKWLQINTDTVRVIFAPGLEKTAGEIVDITRGLNDATLNTIGSRIRKINIVLQHQTTNANGYVGLGPWRSEFYLTPMQNSFRLGSLSWHKSLALHEYRHVQQFNNFRKGVSRITYFIFGEQILGLVNSAAVPDYFWEGDAVYQETLMSGQGRGRLGYFHNGYRSIWAAEKSYSWQKLRNGSLRDYVPDHYQLGYLIVAYGRVKYGDSLWATITDDAVRFRGLFYPWQRSIKKHTGLSYQAFRQDALGYFEKTLKQAAVGKQVNQSTTGQKANQPSTAQQANQPGSTITAGAQGDSLSSFASRRKHFAGDERYPQWISADRVLLVKSDYKNIPAFVIMDPRTGKANKIRVTDISEDQYYSYKNNRIVYAAYQPATRWGWKDYGDIRLLDIRSGKQQNITTRTRYFSPDITGDGQEIVAVEVDPAGKSSLHILTTDTPSRRRVIPNPDRLFYTYPKFMADGNILSAVRNEVGEMALVKVDPLTGSIENLIPWSMNVIGFPLVNKDTITFTASYAGTDRLFMLTGNKLYQVIVDAENSSTGNYQLSVSDGNYAWSGFSAVGYRLQTGKPVFTEVPTSVFNAELPVFGAGIAKTAPSGFLDKMPRGEYQVTKYRKSFNLINPHSFRPYLNEPDFTFSLIGENVLNTFVSELYFNYNSNEKSKEVGANLNYGGLYAWIRGGVNYTFDRSASANGNRVYWDEAEANIGLNLPLNLTGGRWYRRLSVASDYVTNSRTFKGAYKDSFDNRTFGYVRNTLSFSNQVQQARQHIYPRFAQTLNVNYSLSAGSLEANQFLASAYWYFPGLFKTHNLVFNTAFQGRDTLRNALFSNSFPFSRGYTAENYHHMFKLGVNYHLPLVYPDWGFASIVYFQRIRANLFYDFTRINDFNRQGKFVAANFRSLGTELFFDTKWWNQQPLSFGIRYSYLLDASNQGVGKNQWSFILPIELR
ncbi:TolB family protein [Flavitalea antarctica]